MSALQSSAFSLLPAMVVTGAAGFIGRRVVARLAAAGARVVAVDRLPDPGEWPMEATYRQADLEREKIAIDGEWRLIHLAWSMDRTDAVAQAESVAVFGRLLEQEGLTGVVGLGSAEEYGELGGCLREETAPGGKLSPYGRAKHEACQALRDWSRWSGLPAFWLRPFVAYGPGQRGNMAIPYALRCARERHPADFSEGWQARDFVHVDDVAAAIVRAALALPHRAASLAVCNLGRGEPIRLRDVLERIADRLNAREIFRFGARPMRSNEPQEQYAEVAAAARELNWRAQIPWEQGIDALCKEPAKDNHA